MFWLIATLPLDVAALDVATVVAKALHEPVRPFTGTVELQVDGSLRSTEAARSTPGRLRVRPGAVSDVTVRHEMAHHYLWQICPQAADDRLFHEAFALSASGELEQWLGEGYFSSVKAVDTLRRAASLDVPSSRQALARLLGDGVGAALPVAVKQRLQRCVTGAAMEPMTLAELSAPAQRERGEAFFVLSRHSGETLVAEGNVDVPFPYGSTLKPFIVAAAAQTPMLDARLEDPLWRCGNLTRLTAAQALALSCNGYFLEWKAGLGPYGPLLQALGLERLPATTDELIGLRPTLGIAPAALAQAYRVLAEARPDVLEMLRGTAVYGTLAGAGLRGFAVKTGTVRDPFSRAEQGWIVAIDADRVAVMTVRGRMPRDFAAALAERLKKPAPRAASVQVFALLPWNDVSLTCSGVGVRLPAVQVLPRAYEKLDGTMLCLGAPMTVRLPSALGTERAYAGVFSHAPLLQRGKRDDPKARAGSDWLFRTTDRLYAAGVLAAEDASLTGEARLALAAVVAHNAEVDRHGDRPLCDTTHCQAFLGTVHTRRPALDWDAVRALQLPAGWLTFARGGDEVWQETRSAQSVAKALGAHPSVLKFTHGEVRFAGAEANATDEAWHTLPCEKLRSPLKLLSCPQRAEIQAEHIVFHGQGHGHGEGLDVERAKTSGLPAQRILDNAYRR